MHAEVAFLIRAKVRMPAFTQCQLSFSLAFLSIAGNGPERIRLENDFAEHVERVVHEVDTELWVVVEVVV